MSVLIFFFFFWLVVFEAAVPHNSDHVSWSLADSFHFVSLIWKYALDATMVCPLTRRGDSHPRADVQQLERARRCRLVVEVGGRFGAEAVRATPAPPRSTPGRRCLRAVEALRATASSRMRAAAHCPAWLLEEKMCGTVHSACWFAYWPPEWTLLIGPCPLLLAWVADEILHHACRLSQPLAGSTAR